MSVNPDIKLPIEELHDGDEDKVMSDNVSDFRNWREHDEKERDRLRALFPLRTGVGGNDGDKAKHDNDVAQAQMERRSFRRVLPQWTGFGGNVGASPLGHVVHAGTRVVSTFMVCKADGSAAEPFEHAVDIKELKEAPFRELYAHLLGVKTKAEGELYEAVLARARASTATKAE